MAEDITGQDTDLINGEPSEYSNLVTLESLEHVRLRPGMYIGRLGDGSQSDDGIYVLFKEVMDNAVDEHLAGYGNVIEVTLADNVVTIRDYGRGIPLPDVVNAASKMNTSGKFDSSNYKGSVGLNGVGLKATNALSEFLVLQSYRDGKMASARFERGKLIEESGIIDAPEGTRNGTYICFKPDGELFRNFSFRDDIIEPMVKNYRGKHRIGHRKSTRAAAFELVHEQSERVGVPFKVYKVVPLLGGKVLFEFQPIAFAEKCAD